MSSFSQAIIHLFEFSKLGAYLASELDVAEADIMKAISSFEMAVASKVSKVESAVKVPAKTPAKSTKKAVVVDDEEPEEAPKSKSVAKKAPAKVPAKSASKATKKAVAEDDEEPEEEDEKPKSKAPTKKAPAKSASKTTDKHTCCHLLTKGRPGEACGKGAVNEFEGEWYCGIHIKIVNGSPAKADKASAKKTTAKKVGQSPKQNKAVLETLEARELNVRKNAWGNLWDSQSHIVVKQDDEGEFTVIGQQDMTKDAKEKGEKSVIKLSAGLLSVCNGWNLTIADSALPDDEEEASEEAVAETPVEDEPEDEGLEIEEDE